MKDSQTTEPWRLLWDTETCTSPNTRSTYFLLQKSKTAIRTAGALYRLARYLPLDNIRSLTLFFRFSGASCVQIDDDAQRAVGFKATTICITPERGAYNAPYYSSVTYFLGPNEFITSICAPVLTSQGAASPKEVKGPYIYVRASSC